MTTTAKIGAFFVVVLVALAVLIMKIEDIHVGKKKRTNTADAHFKDVAGLDDKSAVRLAGVRIGKVDKISLRPDGTAVVHLELDPGIELHQGASAQIRSLGLLGDKYVELTPGDTNGPRLPNGSLLEGTSGAGFEDVTKLATDIGKDLKEVSSALANSLGGTRGEERMNRIVDNLGRLAESMRELADANRGNVDAIVANLRTLSAQLVETVARVDRMLDENRAGVKSTVSNMDDVTAKLKTTADSLNSITGKIDTGQGTIGKLLNDDETHKNINDALKSVKEGVEQLSGTLGRINRLQLDIGFRTEYSSRLRDDKYYFTLDAIPREGKFYRLEIGSLPHGKREDILESSTVTFPDGSQQTISTTGQRYIDQFVLSLQLGYKLNNTILRAGIIESRGGAAVEQTFKADTFRIAGEIWDFTRPELNGHLKLYTRWNASPNLYVTGGVDDVLNPGLRSAFFGAGIRWKDEDLKALLGSIPIPTK
ncbi:MAG TPA: MlaD family protein [Thermoanaerobaculia bacterium]|nr:MlaD family protein [Thermoanaerobaculia bacterium]